MTSELKCLFCQQDLRKLFNRYTGEPNCEYECENFKCDLYGIEMPESVWQALIQAKQDLEIARKALKSISGVRENIEDYYGGVSIHYQQMVLHMDEIATNALEQIDHIADVSKMVEHKE